MFPHCKACVRRPVMQNAVLATQLIGTATDGGYSVDESQTSGNVVLPDCECCPVVVHHVRYRDPGASYTLQCLRYVQQPQRLHTDPEVCRSSTVGQRGYPKPLFFSGSLLLPFSGATLASHATTALCPCASQYHALYCNQVLSIKSHP